MITTWNQYVIHVIEKLRCLLYVKAILWIPHKHMYINSYNNTLPDQYCRHIKRFCFPNSICIDILGAICYLKITESISCFNSNTLKVFWLPWPYTSIFQCDNSDHFVNCRITEYVPLSVIVFAACLWYILITWTEISAVLCVGFSIFRS